jgi:lipopolysaccharide transport system ATP-binding protein
MSRQDTPPEARSTIMSDVVIQVENLSKCYQLGVISHGTLRRDIQSWWAQVRGKPDPNAKIGHIPHHIGQSGERFWALQDVSFDIQQGEVIGIIGKNGAGKSTLLKILSKITTPTGGCVKLKGRVGSLLEVGTGFHQELTGRENVYLNGAILGMSKAEIDKKFDEIVDFSGIEEFIDTPVKHYSSGMHVRLAFAVAAHLEPEILLVDEVLAVGDATFQRKCLGQMENVAKAGRTVLFVSHNMIAIKRLCEKTYLLDQGHIVTSGNTEMVVDAYYRISMGRDSSLVEEQNVPEGQVKFLNWQVKDSSIEGDAYSCYTNEPCVVSFKIAIRREVKQANFGIALWANDGTLVWAMRNLDDRDEYLFLSKGIYEVCFAIPMLPLRPAIYQILVSANDKEEGTLDAWYAQPHLRVLPKDETGLPVQWQGILNIKGNFNISCITSRF